MIKGLELTDHFSRIGFDDNFFLEYWRWSRWAIEAARPTVQEYSTLLYTGTMTAMTL